MSYWERLRAKSPVPELLAIWLVLTALNLTKAVHIDDTAYLETAQHILTDPWHPMTGLVNWSGTRTPIHEINQPLLFSYLLAALMAAFGESDVVLHSLVPAFSLLAVIFFYLAAARITPRHALVYTALFALGPVFVPGQNVMMDVPMAAFWCVVLWAMLRDAPERRGRLYLIAALAVSAASLTKYTSLVLVPVFFFVVIQRRHWRFLWAPALPVAALVLWSVFNYLDYGGLHLFERRAGVIDLPWRVPELVVMLGAVAPFTPAFVPALARRRIGWLLLAGSVVGGLVSLLLPLPAASEPCSRGGYAVLRALFVANGLLLIALCVDAGLGAIRRPERRARGLMLILLLVTVTAFVAALSPFMAARHLLVVVALALLLLADGIEPAADGPWRAVGLVATIALGLTLGVSDWRYADVYRAAAARIDADLSRTGDRRGTVWFLGHWGWQWYAARAGMRQYDAATSRLRPGDVLVVPSYVQREGLRPGQERQLEPQARVLAIDSDELTFVRTGWPCAGYYALALTDAVPWTVSEMPLERFVIVRVVADAEPAK